MRNTYYILFLVVFFCSCNRDNIDTIEKTIIINPPNEEVNGSISGVVQGAEGLAIAGAMVSLGLETRMTDDQGHFGFIDVPIFEDGTYVQVEKDGYLSGSRKFLALSDASHQVKIQLIRKEGTILDTENGDRIGAGSAYVTLPGGAYQQKGSDHAGTVNVYATWLDPSRQETFYSMPGNLTGIDATGKFKVLTTFGMMRVELEDNEGEEVDLPEGKTALLHFPIPEIMEDYNPPAAVTLWHFDEAHGIWTEEGTAELDGDQYIAEVSHFSYWNLSIASEKVLVSGTVTLDNMIARESEIIIRDIDSGYLVRGITSDQGTFSETVPRGNRLRVEVTTACIYEPFAWTFPGYAVDQSNLDWVLQSRADDILLEGIVVDCNNEPVPNAMVRFSIGNVNEMHRADEQGKFTIEVQPCLEESFSFYTINPFKSQISERQTISNSNFSLGEIITCGDTEIHYDLDYDNMDWKTALDEHGVHTWELNRIGDNIILIHSTMEIDGEKYFDGVFKFDLEDANNLDIAQGEYVIKVTSPTEDFELGGSCQVHIDQAPGMDTFKTYSISGMTTDVTDINTNSQLNIGTLIFDLVYFD